MLPVIQSDGANFSICVPADAFIPRGIVRGDALRIQFAISAGIPAVEDLVQGNIHAVGGGGFAFEAVAVVLVKRGLGVGGFFVIREGALDNVSVFIARGDANHIGAAAIAG